jgi:hypothetical protein
MKPLDPSERFTAFRTAVIVAGVVAVLEIVTAILEQEILGASVLMLVRGVHVGICVLALSALVIRRETVSQAFLTAIMLVVVVPLFVVVWMAQAERTSAGLVWSLFLGEKVVVLAIPELALQPLWLGFVLIVGFVLETVIQTAGLRGSLTPGEPWMTMAVGGVAMLLLLHRMQRLAAERAAARSLGHAEALARLTRTLLAIRDLANTPLQTLEWSAKLLRAPNVDVARVAARMDRALERLRTLRTLLDRYEPELAWQDGDESLDSTEILACGMGLHGQTGRRTTGPLEH